MTIMQSEDTSATIVSSTSASTPKARQYRKRKIAIEKEVHASPIARGTFYASDVVSASKDKLIAHELRGLVTRKSARESGVLAALLLEKAKEFPRHFAAFGALSVLLLTLFCLLGGLILGRSLIAPDFGIAFVVLSLTFWGMAIVSKYEH